jgi:four helix bundle protein
MSTFKRFEDTQAWQKAREVTSLVYSISKHGQFGRDFGLRDQIRRSSVSVMANIAEGFSRRSDKDFAYFLNISRSSAAEVQSHLYVALDQGYIEVADFEMIYSKLEETSRMIFGLARHLMRQSTDRTTISRPTRPKQEYGP